MASFFLYAYDCISLKPEAQVTARSVLSSSQGVMCSGVGDSHAIVPSRAQPDVEWQHAAAVKARPKTTLGYITPLRVSACN